MLVEMVKVVVVVAEEEEVTVIVTAITVRVMGIGVQSIKELKG